MKVFLSHPVVTHPSNLIHKAIVNSFKFRSLGILTWTMDPWDLENQMEPKTPAGVHDGLRDKDQRSK